MSTIPKLTLFPLYPGGPLVKNAGALNADSSFYTRATEFTPAFGVNTPATNRVSNDTYFSIRSNQTLEQKPVSAAGNFTRNLGFDGSVLGNLKESPVPAVAPVIPNLYREMAALYAITDLNFTDLMNEPEFLIPGIGLGLKATTDGLGHIDTLAISPSSRKALPEVSPFSPTFGGPKMAEITEGATFKAIPDTGLGYNVSRDNTAIGNKTGVNLFKTDTVNPLKPQALNPDRGLNALDEDDLNPVLERLLSLQPAETEPAIFGYDATLDPEQMRRVATIQAGLDVTHTNEFKQQVAELVNAARHTDTYANTMKPHHPQPAAPAMDQVMNGRIPAAPSHPAGSPGSSTGFGAGSQQSFEMGANVSDAMNRKSRGGYIPFFRMSGDQSPGFAMAGGGEGFSGASGQTANQGGFSQGAMGSGGSGNFSQRNGQPRKPLTFMA